MQQVSSVYRRETQKRVQGAAHCRVTLGVTDTDAAETAACSTNGESVYSDTHSMLHSLGAPLQSYATFEPGRLRLNGTQRIAPAQGEAALVPEGYLGAALSGEDGAFAVPPRLRLTFSRLHSVPALTFVFDSVCGEYPASLHLCAWRENTLLCEETVQPNAAVYVWAREILRFDALELTFLRTAQPQRRARLGQLIFGAGLCFTGTALQSVRQTAACDPLARSLANGSVQFSVVNRNTLTAQQQNGYNPDNPAGVWRFLEQRNPVQVSFGQGLTGGLTWGELRGQSWQAANLACWGAIAKGGYVEWVNAGTYYLTAQPQVEGLTANFEAQDTLSLLSGVYRKGVYAPQGQSLYALAEAVLQDAALPALRPGVPPWRLWEGLRNITTPAPLPVAPQRECLQLIANTAGCAVYCARDGAVCIAPMGSAETGVTLDFAVQRGEPVVQKNAPLAAVCCTAAAYVPAAQRTQLHKANYAVNGTLHLTLSHGMATDIAAEAQGGSIAAFVPYAQESEVTLTGSGTVTLLLTGVAVEKRVSAVTAAVPEAPANAETATLENPLIATPQQAMQAAERLRDYLTQRTVYTLTTGGSAELEPLDCLAAQTLFEPACAARVLQTETVYDGGLKTTLTVKRREILATH